MLTAREALQRLWEGQARFRNGAARGWYTDAAQLRELAREQKPWAIVVGCSDSRVAPEIVFDRSLGELFVVRVAGHLLDATAWASIEFAVVQLGVRLIVVLGHSQCGAIATALREIGNPTADLTPSLRRLVEHIRPVVAPLLQQPLSADDMLSQAMRIHVHRTVSMVRDHFRSLASVGCLAGEVPLVVGAAFDIATGCVTFFDDT
ncbi:MAG: carbonic anhydrase [Gemmataceae bacterium]